MIEVNNLTKEKIDKESLIRVAKKVLKGENKVLNISIALVNEERIRELNKKYKRIDKATDVLSFADGLNEIIICPNMARGRLNETLIHGVLHILGYEHGKEMESKQKSYLKIFNIKC